jgi:Arc/MetJ family transcription regulator
MATNLAIDDMLLERARRVGKLRTKKETVTFGRSVRMEWGSTIPS